jgi:PAS domain S-box-containing protein
MSDWNSGLASIHERWTTRRCAIIILALAGVIWPGAARAETPAAPVILTDQAGRYPLGLHLEYLSDSTGALTLDQVQSPGYAAQFVVSQQDVLNLGFTRAVYWVRGRLLKRSVAPLAWLLEIAGPFTDLIDVYLPTPSGQFAHSQVGDSFPFAQREVNHRHFLFWLALPDQEECVFYLRFQNKGRITVDLTIWDLPTFAHAEYRRQLLSGLFYGAVLIMAAYNALSFLLLRERIYLSYVALTLTLGLVLLNNEGYAYQYLWPRLVWWNDVSLITLTGLTGIIAMAFSLEFLHVADYHRLLLRLIQGGVVLWGLLTAAFLLTRHPLLPQLVVALHIPSPLLLLAAGVLVWRKGYRPARYYLLSWGMLFTGSFLEVLGMYGVIPLALVDGKGLRLGLASALALLSLALADRIHLLKQEKADAQARALEASQDNERFIREQNLILEDRVAERTQALRQSNEQLQHEISDRQQIEGTLRKLEKAIETTDVGITITDPEGRIIYINPADARNHGYAVAEVLGQSSKIFAPPDEQRHGEELDGQTEPQAAIWKRERFNSRKDGSVFPVQLISTRIHADDGAYLGRVTVCTDITEAKKAQDDLLAAHRELQEKNAQLQELNASKDKFFSIISHDLRSPFTSLLGFAQLLDHNLDTYSLDEIRHRVHRIYASAERLHTLLENLLTWSRLQRGVMAYEPEAFSLQELADYTLDLFASKAEEKHIRLTNTIHTDTCVYADHNMISTVIRNLVSNALKFTPEQGIVAVSAHHAGPHVEVVVADTGTGIPCEHLPKLFRLDTQYTTFGTAGESGTGLGLLLCQELIEHHGGRIWVESQVERGTTFRFTLPRPSS